MISKWRTSKGACDRKQPEDKNSLILDQGNQVQDKPAQASYKPTHFLPNQYQNQY